MVTNYLFIFSLTCVKTGLYQKTATPVATREALLTHSYLTTMQSIPNRDVWSEILRQFEIDLTGDRKEDIQLKRRTILSIALSHPNLVDVAVNELWRSMTSLEPIKHVLNAGEELIPVLQYNQGFWVSPTVHYSKVSTTPT